MITSDDVSALSEALVAAQAQIDHAARDGENPHLNSQYATLRNVIDVTRDPLAEAGLAVIQTIGFVDQRAFLRTRLVHKSGQFIQDDCPLSMGKSDMQSLGSAVTYARRYALAAMLGVAQADDDGEQAASEAVSERFARRDGRVSLGALKDWCRQFGGEVDDCGDEDEYRALLDDRVNIEGQALLRQHLEDWYFGKGDAKGLARKITEKHAELQKAASEEPRIERE